MHRARHHLPPSGHRGLLLLAALACAGLVPPPCGAQQRTAPENKTAPRQQIWYHTGYPGGVSGPRSGMSARMGPTKMPLVFEAIRRARLVSPGQLHTDGVKGAAPAALPIDLASLRAVHSDRYLKAVLTGRPRSLACSQGLSTWSPEMARGWLLNLGGLYAAAETALRDRTFTANLGHGYHHATPEKGGGYCTLNGLAVVARKLLRGGRARRIMVIDLDQHEGNGTAECVLGDGRLYNVSIYGTNMGGPPAAANNHVLKVEHDRLARGRPRDLNYLAAISFTLPALIRKHDPDLILYQAGMDPHDCAGITPGALAARDAYVFALARSMNKPVTWVLAGGYADVDTLRKLHTGTVRMASRVLERVHPGDRVQSSASGQDPFAWSVRRGVVTFPDWSGLAGELKVTRPEKIDQARAQKMAAARDRMISRHRLPDAELLAAYRALVGN